MSNPYPYPIPYEHQDLVVGITTLILGFLSTWLFWGTPAVLIGIVLFIFSGYAFSLVIGKWLNSVKQKANP